MLAREGHVLTAAAGGLATLFIAAGFLWGGGGWAIAMLGTVLLGAVVWSFRDPLLAPADGVVEIVVEEEPLYLGGPSQPLSIALSPLDVSVNRSPITVAVEYERSVQWGSSGTRPPRASDRTVRSEVGVRHASGTHVLFKQVAGAGPKRISYRTPVGSRLAAGERYGTAPFGSRMDVAVPPHVHLDVTPGQRTVAGETVLSRIPGAPSEAPTPAPAGATAPPAGVGA